MHSGGLSVMTAGAHVSTHHQPRLRTLGLAWNPPNLPHLKGNTEQILRVALCQPKRRVDFAHQHQIRQRLQLTIPLTDFVDGKV